ncbi:MAG: DNA mismatch repair endonuclease MutL [Clostridiales Family XIII bacterium]|jgi:DNA mismatch repair protein MutL|nr:DNA mismatch repair endonuclease MutL [Clostridiales Family XIII bacterium]
MIKLLPREVYDLIAAGEVVTAPLSVVKELVENAIDAGAERITVEILGGGMERIRVTDDGSGIAADEIALAFTPHATSKISTAEDLYRAATLGFRGEALASVAAVSHVTLSTRTAGTETGARAVTSPGETLKTEPFGTDQGTDIIIEQLFENLPARKKHLRSARAETTKITDYLSRVAVYHADISFRYLADGALVFATRGAGDRLAAIQTVYGSAVAQNLVWIPGQARDDNTFSVSGYISNPLGLRKTRKGQVFFVNGRPVRNQVIETAVSEAYREFAEAGRFPVVFLFLEVAPGDVDVNVHPAKEEVALADGPEIQRFVYDAIRDVLTSEQSIPKLRFPGTDAGAKRYFAYDIPEKPPTAVPEIVSELLVSTYGGAEEHIAEVDINTLLDTNVAQLEISSENRSEVTLVDDNQFRTTKTTDQFKLNIPSLRVLASLFAAYLLAADGDNLYLIDQHAAHERVNFERFLQKSKQGDSFSQELAAPYIFDPPPGAVSALRNRPEVFSRLGFELEEFGEGVWRATAFPAFLRFAEAEAFLAELLAAAADGDISKDEDGAVHSVRTERLIMRACKASVKAGDLLNDGETIALLEDLSSCDNPYTCPHGRPVFLKLSKSDIERLFKRAGAPG